MDREDQKKYTRTKGKYKDKDIVKEIDRHEQKGIDMDKRRRI